MKKRNLVGKRFEKIKVDGKMKIEKHIEEKITTALKNKKYEHNDSFTRLAVINMIDPFLRYVEGIFDYMIVCDERNNTPERIDRNELWCDIYIKPTRTAEFIVLNIIASYNTI